MSFDLTYDTIVIGGGPAGSTASTFLAQKNRRVLVIEKEKFPRYHIGESLLPYCYFTLERLGLLERMKRSKFPKKYSVQFVSMNGRASQPFYFFQHLKHEAATTWQVVRSEFDRMLLDNARAAGVDVLEETLVKEFIMESDAVVGVKAMRKDGAPLEFRAPMTIDASGRDAFAMRSYQWQVRDPQLRKIALWTYYKGAKRDEGLDEGATTVAYLPEKGWFWYIPLPDDIISVGIVTEPDYLYRDGKDLEKIYDREIENNVWIKEHLALGKRCDGFHVTSDFSFRSSYCARDGLLLAGDAYCFLDPVFSSGVFLALKSGELAADFVDRALQNRDYSAGQFREYSETLGRGIEAMRKLVYAFYDCNFRFKDMLVKYPHLHGDLTDCLIGNLFIDFDPLFTAVREFAQLPEPLTHGKPFSAEMVTT